MDMISFVRRELAGRNGSLRRIAEETGIAYDTLLRIKNGEGDPGYSKVAHLASYFGWFPGVTAVDAVQQERAS
ncbi:helix-turn-helix transcriptional regulator [Methyloversatilis universalis]|nr:helix-turn-helix transcriptional regulator [Methyloversatilis universalis]